MCLNQKFIVHFNFKFKIYSLKINETNSNKNLSKKDFWLSKKKQSEICCKIMGDIRQKFGSKEYYLLREFVPDNSLIKRKFLLEKSIEKL